MDSDETAAAWVCRTIGFGATVDDLDRARAIGIDRFVEELLDPVPADVTADDDPWTGLDLELVASGPRAMAPAVLAWIARMRNHRRPFEEWLPWFWHGHLVSSFLGVRSPAGLVDQVRLFRRLGAGSFPGLLRAVTIDAAMLRYLDGDRSTADRPNENYSRELLELFALGIGNFTESDVQAGAAALTGWTRTRRTGEIRFVPVRHDSTPQSYLGAEGVHDLDTVIDAVVAHPACAEHLVNSFATAILGRSLTGSELSLEATEARREGLAIVPLVRRLVTIGLAGGRDASVLPYLPWLIGLLRTTQSNIGTADLAGRIRAGGQAPFFAPTVAGWPSGSAWLSTSVTTARLETANILADNASDDCAPLQAAESTDLTELARSLGRPAGFSPTTIAALESSGQQGRTLLALAMSTPDLVIT